MRFERVSARDLTRIFAMEKNIESVSFYAAPLASRREGLDFEKFMFPSSSSKDRNDLSFSSVTLYKSRDYD